LVVASEPFLVEQRVHLLAAAAAEARSRQLGRDRARAVSADVGHCGRPLPGPCPLAGTSIAEQGRMGSLWTTLVASLVAGASSSGPCLVMCGPLACAACPTRSPASAASYHGARVVAYAGLGALAGLLGGGVARTLAISVRPALPWVMAAALVA